MSTDRPAHPATPGSGGSTAWWGPWDADRSVIADREVAIIGFDATAELHAQNLRDSGVDVRVGAEPGGPEHDAASSEGFFTLPVADAVADSEVVVLGEHHLERVAPVVAPEQIVVLTSAAAGRALRGSGIRHRGVILLVEVLGEPAATRRAYVDGRGAPAVVAVVARGRAAGHDLALQLSSSRTPEPPDARGDHAQRLAVAYADVVGATRAAAIGVDALDWAAAADFADTRVTPLLEAVLAAGRDALVSEGFDPVVADLAVLHRLRSEWDRLSAEGARPSSAEAQRQTLTGLTGPAPRSRSRRTVPPEDDAAAAARHARLGEAFGGSR
ncbi:ketol-acid reductoisomerase [Kytococcus sp. Marseille-QA3725]